MKGIRFSFRKVKSAKKLLLSVLLLLSFFLTSCSDVVNFIQESPFFPVINTTPLQRDELVTLLISCISDTSNQKIQAVYEKIPRAQLDGLSFSSFDAYIKALRRMTRSVTSFRFPANEEKDILLSRIEDSAPGYSELVNRSIPVEIKGNDKEKKWYFYLQVNKAGNVSLSSEWVEGCLLLYRYATLYFHAIDGGNQRAVETLLQGAIVPEIDGNISSLVIDYKAEEILSYYQRQVRERYENFVLKSLDISQLTYEQQNFYDEATDSIIPREIFFIQKSPQVISVKDTISSPLKVKDFVLYKNGVEVPVRIGDQTSDAILREFMGEPFVISATEERTENEQQTIVVGYEALSLTIFGKLSEDGTWHGQITRIRIRDDSVNFRMGNVLFVGMELDGLLQQYPFADLENYALEVDNDGQVYRMTFSIDSSNGGYVQGINLEMVRTF